MDITIDNSAGDMSAGDDLKIVVEYIAVIINEIPKKNKNIYLDKLIIIIQSQLHIGHTYFQR